VDCGFRIERSIRKGIKKKKKKKRRMSGRSRDGTVCVERGGGEVTGGRRLYLR
jgi:hypothetical protein